MKMKEFMLKDIFHTVPFRGGLQVPTGGMVPSKELKSGNIPRISVTSMNNGIIGYYADMDSKNYRVYDNCISVSFLGTVFYHPYRASFDMKVHCLKPKNHDLKRGEALYLVSCIEKLVCHNTYGNQTSSTDLPYMKISLPAKTAYEPNFDLLSEIIGGGIDMSNIDTSSWKEFLITDLFELCPVKSKLTKLDLCNTGVVPVYSSETSNNGINGYTDVAAQFIVDEKTPLYLVFGDHTRSMNIAEESFCVMDNVKVLKPKCSVSVETLLYISTVWKKAISDLGYARHWSVAKDLTIKRPVKESEEIDWEYMQERITELEQERITELEQYLIATGLNDYELTDEDKDILATKLTGGGILQNSISGNGCLKEARMFRIGDLFNVEGTKSLDAGALEFRDTGVNFVGRTDENNGVQGMIDRQVFAPNDAKTITATVIGNYKYVKYQEEPYYCSQNVNKLTPVFPINQFLGLYFRNVIQKFVSLYDGRQSGYKLDELRDYTFILPIQTDTNNTPVIDQNHTYHPDGYIPDWTYMEKYIRAIEKVVIKDVVDYKDSIITKTKEIVA